MQSLQQELGFLSFSNPNTLFINRTQQCHIFSYARATGINVCIFNKAEGAAA
jgi:hypothetical protein